MADLAKQLNEDAKLWRIVGLLHDLDYDAVKGDMRNTALCCRETNGKASKEAIHAIKAMTTE
jgi:predicted hydrolase (HD superfamily)